MGRRAVVAFVLLAAWAGCAEGSPAPGAPAQTALPGSVAFSFGGRIHVMRPDGSDRVRLTGGRFPRSEGGDYDPAWSPDGSRLAFVRAMPLDEVSRSHIYLVDARGGQARRLPLKGDVSAPAWSPDGSRLAFVRWVGREDSLETQVVVTGLDGAGEQILFRELYGEDRRATVNDVAWSPDGSRLLFTRTELDRRFTFRPSLYVMKADGSDVRLLARDAGGGAWSPDGSRIAYSSIRDRNGKRCWDQCTIMGELYVMDADGTDAVRLTRNQGDDRTPTWAPDGRTIAFASDRNGPGHFNYELYSIAADGSCLTWLTNGTPESRDPAWSGGASGVCGGRRPRALVNRRPVRPAGGEPAYWLGNQYRGLLISSAEVARQGRSRHTYFFLYDDCSRFRPESCAPEFQLQEVSVCSRSGQSTLPVLDQADYGAPVRAYAAHGLLFVDIGQHDLSAVVGTRHVRLFPGVGGAAGRRFAERALLALRPVGGRAGRLPSPALPAEMLRRLERTDAARASSGSVAGAAAALGIPVQQVRRRLELWRAVEALPRLRSVDCRP